MTDLVLSAAIATSRDARAIESTLLPSFDKTLDGHPPHRRIRAIFQGEYWVKVRAEDCLGGGVLLTVDIAVNMGPVVGTRFFPGASRMRADSVFGLGTLDQLQRVNGRASLIQASYDGRFWFWHALSTLWWFEKGWMARGNDIEARPLRLAAASWI